MLGVYSRDVFLIGGGLSVCQVGRREDGVKPSHLTTDAPDFQAVAGVLFDLVKLAGRQLFSLASDRGQVERWNDPFWGRGLQPI